MFIPNSFVVPPHLSNDRFHFEILAPGMAELDYEAVMSSKQRLRHVFAESDEWPADNMSFAENKTDLIRHENEFKAREAFAYSVFNASRDSYIGCVYIDPSKHSDYDCEVYLWVRDSAMHYDQPLFDDVEHWLSGEWPFDRRAYPGRSIRWSEWSRQEST